MTFLFPLGLVPPFNPVNRLLIIQPSYYQARQNRTVFKVRRRQVVPLTLPYLAALSPPDWEIKLLDEQLEPVDFDYRADLVAITTWTLTAHRAYDIADEFRRRGVKVILGGPHTFFHAEEAGEHCDAVGIGEAEGIWNPMLADARRAAENLPFGAAALAGRTAPAALRPVEYAAIRAVQDVFRGVVARLSVSL